MQETHWCWRQGSGREHPSRPTSWTGHDITFSKNRIRNRSIDLYLSVSVLRLQQNTLLQRGYPKGHILGQFFFVLYKEPSWQHRARYGHLCRRHHYSTHTACTRHRWRPPQPTNIHHGSWELGFFLARILWILENSAPAHRPTCWNINTSLSPWSLETAHHPCQAA